MRGNLSSREKLTLTVDSTLKRAVEAAKGVKFQTFGELLDLSMRSFLISLHQSNYIEEEIARKEVEISQLKTEIIQLKGLKETIDSLPDLQSKGETKEIDDLKCELEANRVKKFNEMYCDQDKLLRLDESIRTFNVVWSSIVDNYDFENKAEAKLWFRIKIKERLECL